MSKRVAVLGAGISGLTAALELQELGCEVVVLEASTQCGGAIQSHRDQGFLAESGPHTIAGSNAAVEKLLDRLGLQGKRCVAGAAAKRRYAVRNGRVHALPSSLSEAVKSEYLSKAAGLRLLAEPFVEPRHDDIDESVTMFVNRRLGEELMDYGVDLMINGIWAGDPNRLSMRHAFKKVWGLERDFGSLIKGGMKRAKEASKAPVRYSKELFSFEGGNQDLVDALVARLDVKTSHKVESVLSVEGGFEVVSRHKNRKVKHRVDSVISTVPAWALGEMAINGVRPSFPKRLSYPKLAVTTLGFRRADVPHPLDGFGMLIPKREERRILGALFTSSLFPGRAPKDHITLAVFSGGMRDEEMALCPPQERLQVILSELQSLLGLRGEPVWTYERVWERAIPQYEVGHGKIIVEIQALERSTLGLWIGGNFRDAVSVPDLIAAGEQQAHRAAHFLGVTHH